MALPWSAAAQVFVYLPRGDSSLLSSLPAAFIHLHTVVLDGRLPMVVLGGGAWRQPPRGGARRRPCELLWPGAVKGLGEACVCGQKCSRWG